MVTDQKKDRIEDREKNPRFEIRVIRVPMLMAR
jgi:hypothetical protein